MGVTCLMVVLLAQAVPEVRSIAPRDEVTEAVKAPARGVTMPASVDVRSSLTKRFKLVEARLLVDGQELSHRQAARGHELESQFRLYEGAMKPGAHSITVSLIYEGRNKGPFTYLDDYRYRVEGSGDFTAQEGKGPASIEVLAYERPGATVPVEQKPTLEIKALPGSAVTAAVRPPGR